MNPEKISSNEAPQAFVLGRTYDFPIPKRPNAGAKGVVGDNGQKFDVYGASMITFSDFVKANPDKLVLMQTEGYTVTAMTAKEVNAEFNMRTPAFQRDCMVLVPQE